MPIDMDDMNRPESVEVDFETYKKIMEAHLEGMKSSEDDSWINFDDMKRKYGLN